MEILISIAQKINCKNSWTLELIDHMGELIVDETNDRGEKGINFQKVKEDFILPLTHIYNRQVAP